MSSTLRPSRMPRLAKRHSVVVGLAMIGAMLGFSPADDAEARVNGLRLDSGSVQCGALQDESDALRKEAADPKTTAARRQEIKDRLNTIEQDWKLLCAPTFGSITAFRISNPGILVPHSTEMAPSR